MYCFLGSLLSNWIFTLDIAFLETQEWNIQDAQKDFTYKPLNMHGRVATYMRKHPVTLSANIYFS